MNSDDEEFSYSSGEDNQCESYFYKEQIEYLEKENSRLKTEIEQLEIKYRELDSLVQDGNSYRSKTLMQQRQIEDLTNRLKISSKTINELEQRSSERETTFAEEVEVTKKELSNLRRENKSFVKKFNQIQSQHESVVSDLQNELSESNQKIHDILELSSHYFQTAFSTPELLIKFLQTRPAPKKVETITTTPRELKLQDKLRLVKAKLSDTEKKLSQCQNQARQNELTSASRISDLTEQVDSITRDLNATVALKTQEITQIRREFERFKQESRIKPKPSVVNTLATEKVSIEDVKIQRKLDKAKSKNRELSKRFQKQEEQIRNLESSLIESKRKIADLESSNNSLETQLKAKTVVQSHTEVQLKTLEQHQNQQKIFQDISKYRQIIIDLRERIAILEDERSELRHRISVRDAQINEFQSRPLPSPITIEKEVVVEKEADLVIPNDIPCEAIDSRLFDCVIPAQTKFQMVVRNLCSFYERKLEDKERSPDLQAVLDSIASILFKTGGGQYAITDESQRKLIDRVCELCRIEKSGIGEIDRLKNELRESNSRKEKMKMKIKRLKREASALDEGQYRLAMEEAKHAITVAEEKLEEERKKMTIALERAKIEREEGYEEVIERLRKKCMNQRRTITTLSKHITSTFH